MLSRRTRLLLLAGGVCAAVLPAVAQPPESGLPPGFGDPKPAPPPTPTPPTTVTPTIPDPNVVPPGFGEEPTPTPPRATTRVERMPIEETTDSALTDLELLPPPPPPPFYDLPKGTERPVDVVGLINITNRGLALDAFGDASGPFLATLMQRLEAPLPSRWGQILLRRALISRVAAPRMLDPVDFVAERVRLLVRMGEADAARMLAQSIDVNSYNPNMVRAGYEAALATADPAGLCPLVRKGRDAFRDPVWPMADAMCAALEGESGRASALLDEARRNGARGPDLLLAEKVIGAGTNTRRAVSIRWEDIPEVNMWRFGLASAAGAIIPGPGAGHGRAANAGVARAGADGADRRPAGRRRTGPRRSASSPRRPWSMRIRWRSSCATARRLSRRAAARRGGGRRRDDAAAHRLCRRRHGRAAGRVAEYLGRRRRIAPLCAADPHGRCVAAVAGNGRASGRRGRDRRVLAGGRNGRRGSRLGGDCRGAGRIEPGLGVARGRGADRCGRRGRWAGRGLCRRCE
jgi:hypothetical protein